MTASQQSQTVSVVHRVKKEIDRLTEEQAETLKTATYIGMTPEGTKDYDARHARITHLLEQLELLEKAI